MTNYDFWMFDYDGTLADTYEVLKATHEGVLEKLNIDVAQDPRWYEEWFGKDPNEIFSGLYGKKAENARELFYPTLEQTHYAAATAIDGAQELLEELHAQQKLCAIVTNKKRIHLDPELEKFGWNDFFMTTIAVDETQKNKPHPDPLAEAVKRAGDIKTPLMIGDTENDMLAAKAYGCDCIIIHPDPETLSWCNDYDRLTFVKDLHELKQNLLHSPTNGLQPKPTAQ